MSSTMGQLHGLALRPENDLLSQNYHHRGNQRRQSCTQVWAEMADGSCRWRQTGSEIKIIALKVRVNLRWLTCPIL